MNVHTVLRQCALDLLDTEEHVTVDRVVGCAYQRHGDSFVEAQQQMVLAAARTIVGRLMRDLTEDDEDDQLVLPGLNLPSAIAVVSEDGTYYVRSDKATWSELQAGRKIRFDNVAAAQARLDAYDETLEVLRPVMENTPDSVTVRQALDLLQRQAS